MARTVVRAVRAALNEGAALNFVSATSAADGFAAECAGQDERTTVFLQSDASERIVTVKAGDGIMGVADEEITVPANGTVAVRLESMRFKRVTGDDKGYIVIVPPVQAVKCAVLISE